MADVEGTRTFQVGGDAYDRFMGRYSRELAGAFADFVGVGATTRVLDVGCGPGAFTTVAVDRAGAANVSATDPTPAFVEVCRARNRAPGVLDRPASRSTPQGASTPWREARCGSP